MTRIPFVRHWNICRSPMAEFMMKGLAGKAGRDILAGCQGLFRQL